MPVEVGEPIGFCACGCGGLLYERIYHYAYRPSNPIKKYPTRIVGHTKPPAVWSTRSDMVPSEQVWKLLSRFKQQYGFTWDQLTDLMGFNYNVWEVGKRRYISKQRAEKILRTIRQYHLDQT